MSIPHDSLRNSHTAFADILEDLQVDTSFDVVLPLALFWPNGRVPTALALGFRHGENVGLSGSQRLVKFINDSGTELSGLLRREKPRRDELLLIDLRDGPERRVGLSALGKSTRLCAAAKRTAASRSLCT